MKLLRFGVGFGILFWCGGVFFWVFVLLFGFKLWLGFLVFFGLCLCCAVYLLEQDDYFFCLLRGGVGFSLEWGRVCRQVLTIENVSGSLIP